MAWENNKWFNGDDDDDGMADEDELRFGLNPWLNDAVRDTDHDGICNGDEIINGLNPTDAGDRLTEDQPSQEGRPYRGHIKEQHRTHNLGQDQGIGVQHE